MMNRKLVLVVGLWVKEVNIAWFETFERKATRRVAKYGGQIERVIHLDDSARMEDQPHEIHLVSFLDESAYVAC
jgi:hypothetical protein